MEKIKLTTTHNFEGYKIINYIGVETVSKYNVAIKYLTKVPKGETYSDVNFREAKAKIFEMMNQKVIELGGNAIVGVTVQMNSISEYIVVATVTGTIVEIEKK